MAVRSAAPHFFRRIKYGNLRGATITPAGTCVPGDAAGGAGGVRTGRPCGASGAGRRQGGCRHGTDGSDLRIGRSSDRKRLVLPSLPPFPVAKPGPRQGPQGQTARAAWVAGDASSRSVSRRPPRPPPVCSRPRVTPPTPKPNRSRNRHNRNPSPRLNYERPPTTPRPFRPTPPSKSRSKPRPAKPLGAPVVPRPPYRQPPRP